MNSDHKSTVLECLKNWEETDIRPREDTTVEVGFLARIIGSLSALESVEVLESDGCETKLDLPQHYSQRRREIYEKFPEAVSEDATYRMSVDNEKQHAPSIMAALCVGLGSSRTIKSLTLNCLDWATFLSGDTDEPRPLMVRMHRQLLRPLSKLYLGQSKNSTSFEEPGWYYDALRTLLSSATSLEWLDLSPGNRTATHLSYHFGFSESEQWFFSGLHFVRLRKLLLTNFVAAEKEVVQFLKRHAPSLHTLTLGDACLTNKHGEESLLGQGIQLHASEPSPATS